MRVLLTGTVLVSLVLTVAQVTDRAGRAETETASFSVGEFDVGVRPNVLKIVLDDLSPGMMGAIFYPEGGAQANLLPLSTALIGDQGTKFTSFLTHTPSCCPSRATIATGRYDHNNGVRTLSSIGALDMSSTVQHYLKDAGYCTGIAGKFFNGWTFSQAPPYFTAWATMKQGVYNNPPVNDNGVIQWPGGYATTLLGDKSIQILDQFQNQGCSNWYLDVNMIAPHRTPSRNYPIPEAKYADAPVALWQAPSEADRSDKPQWIRNMSTTQESKDAEYTAMARALMSVDDQIGRLIAKLDTMGQLSNTIIMLMPDNGYNLGEHGARNKFLPYTPSLRGALMMRWDGHLIPGSIDSRMTGTVDITPTILDAVGISQSPQFPLDGQSLLAPPTRTEGLGEYWYDTLANKNIRTWATLVDAKSQYIEWYDSAGVVVFREYYDLVKDSQEWTNLYQDGEATNDPPIAPLASRLDSYRTCAGTAGSASVNPCP